MGRVTVRRKVLAVDLAAGSGSESSSSPRVRSRADVVAVEEPLEIRVDGRQVAVTMRTPGHDVELVHGLLFAEAVIGGREDVRTARYCAGAVVSTETGFDENTYNVLDVSLTDPDRASLLGNRSLLTTSACGVCGAQSIDHVLRASAWSLADDDTRWPASLIVGLGAGLLSAQKGFAATGGLHGAALFGPDGTLVVAREDVGRHNAVDKVIGHALLSGLLPLRGHLLMVSSRASFELAQKAVMAGIPALVVVSAPSSLAIDVATRTNLSLIGFARGERFTIYAGAERVDLTGTSTHPTDTETDTARDKE